ncbi:MAG TPA: 4Fe-4S ferredoxin [Syntrophobacteraceae bacterium]|nr:4Fe-4S ferredoxin [Syntrophobacteraceae bacterium]
MASKVFFSDLRATKDRNLLDKIRALMGALEPARHLKRRGTTAIKIHFGERGNTAFIRPLLVRPIVDEIMAVGSKPFLTDANTLYIGSRGNAVDHLNTALANGFSPSVVGAPVIIADGLDGKDEVPIPVSLKHFEHVYIGSAVARANNLVSLAHFKLHEMAGFGGALKNVGMGAASRRGKMAQHCDVAPLVHEAKCVGCGACAEVCGHEAITLKDRPAKAGAKRGKGKKLAQINGQRCVGCGMCLHTCPNGAIDINWATALPSFLERMVEYTVGAIKGKEGNSLFFNFLTQISPACDCYPHADAPLVPDIGILASLDPIAIDQASADLLNSQAGLPSSCLEGDALAPGSDKIRAVYPMIPWEHQLEYAEQVGLGTRAYELIPVA